MGRAGIVAIVVLLATACGGTPFPGSLSSSQVSTSTIPSAEVQARYTGRFPAPPAGFVPLSQSAPGDGALTVASISGRAPNPSASRSLLAISGFRDGFAREWVTPDFLKGYSIRIYRFADADGAHLYLQADIKGSTRQLKDGGVSVSTDNDLPGSPTIIEAGKVDQYKNWAQLTLVDHDNYVLAIRYFSRAPLSSPDALLTITRAAIGRLPVDHG